MNGRPWRAWWAMSRFWWAHRKDAGFRWVRVDTAYGWWCETHHAATLYTGAHGMELEAQMTEAAKVIAADIAHKVGRHM